MEYQLYYWGDENAEVDFVIVRGDHVVAVEVKSGKRQINNGLESFRKKFHPQYSLVVGGESMSAEQFFSGDLARLL